MVNQVLFGIDVGTSGIKIAAFDGCGHMVARTVKTYRSSTPASGWAEVDADAVWAAAVDGIGSCLEALTAKLPNAQIVGIGLCGLLATIGVDEHGEAITPAVLWSDRRAIDQMKALTAAVPPDLLIECTGRPPAPERGACIAMWWRDTSPQSFRRIRRILSLKDYLLYRLTGVIATDWLNAAYTLLFDIRTRTWQSEFMKAAGLSPELFPPLFSPAHQAGQVLSRTARETGLKAGIPVAVGGPDGSMAAVGAGSLDYSVLVDTAGTTDTVLASVADCSAGGHLGLVTNPHILPDRWLVGGPTTSTGAVWSWWNDQFANPVGAERISHTELDAAASSVPPGANGLIFLPTLVGDRTPGWNPAARGAIVGLNLQHGPGHVARAIVEGTAIMVRRCLNRIRQGGADPTIVHLVGGAANSAFWTQVRADMLGLPVRRLRTPEASAWGAALMGGLASGFYSDPSSVPLDTDHVAGICHPDPQNRALYDELYDTAEIFLDQLAAPFDRLASWRERHEDL